MDKSYVYLNVIQKPIKVEFECPNCGEENSVDYSQFISEIGDVCDWTGSKVVCKKCDEIIEIIDADWG